MIAHNTEWFMLKLMTIARADPMVIPLFMNSFRFKIKPPSKLKSQNIIQTTLYRNLKNFDKAFVKSQHQNTILLINLINLSC